MSSTISMLPSARRLMGSLRDIGYDLPAAIADLVDNSLDANARSIEIDVHPDGSESWIRLTDDGMGMSPRELDEAMRYGSHRDYSDGALGHFGLGLKTGSLSQCRRLTVASRRTPRSRLEGRRWDLDQVAKHDSWDLDSLGPKELPSHCAEPLKGRAGTVVLWEKLDRVLAFRNPDGGHTARSLDVLIREVRSHLAMAFHRFLSGEWTDGREKVSITINAEQIKPWDPFARAEPRTRVLPVQTIELPTADDGTVEILVQPYILPSQTHFSTPGAHSAAAGPNRWNRQQGLYVYRRERLIQSGGWNRLRTLDEHAKLARIAVDLPAGEEHLFGINVSKMSVSMPDAVRASLRAIASAVVQEAQRSYREHLHQAVPPPTPDTVPDYPAEMGGPVGGPSISGDWPLILRSVNEALPDDAEARESVLLRLANAFG